MQKVLNEINNVGPETKKIPVNIIIYFQWLLTNLIKLK
jgi:hypothetical protein